MRSRCGTHSLHSVLYTNPLHLQRDGDTRKRGFNIRQRRHSKFLKRDAHVYRKATMQSNET